MGDYVLSEADFRPDSRFDDEIGRYSYPIDIHPEPGREAYRAFMAEHSSRRLGLGESYSIPYRILLPQKLSGIYRHSTLYQDEILTRGVNDRFFALWLATNYYTRIGH